MKDFSEFNGRYQSDLTDAGFDTLAVRAGQVRTHECEHSEAIFTTSSYVFNSAAEAAARFSGEVPGNVYSRYMNPTVRTFEERLAALEGGELCAATASGMAAIYSVCIAHMQAGDHLVSSRSVFGSTNIQFERYLRKFNVDITYVDLLDIDAWRAAIKDNTKMLFLESPSNPLTEIADIRALAELAKETNTLLVVDNCFCTPALQKPLALGADLVIHSATKYIDGQGRCIGGAVVGSAELIEPVVGVLRSVGPTMSPFNAWVFLKGLETLGLRMKAHSENALALAQWLEQHPKVTKVNYVGLPTHPQHELAMSQQTLGGGVLSFEVAGGREAAWKVIDATRMISITANLGDTKTTVTHPGTTTHGRLTDEQRDAAGISQALIRIAVGLEDVQDIIADLASGLDAL
ncbi:MULTISPECIES: O-succinylhomoserine sulfhydrylase [Thalassolituus]|jgi:O-succinylhomoserine sulfhydrylase|uniref:O-succinylhomoserine sulfhydrylase n=2 Tax=root TaxID=1 RepID=M5DR44_9GAMM|nr:O-succinylhomoserine sulfhydrylase [Thalassolituus oleivorans]PCI46943.1 MAG: O-succinylhomoserine sulfhydrylase [Oceanospirillales bacterium]PHQ85214.1 MAG: O-succinylhomoserine sulfhydrylase [Thalassobium sp.]APR67311.1 O-succinylhomoserine sulfhydrylase [Thalassolituus oleivorans]MBQ0728859.1 O-succinylhomoserine sulfhydrylase [Thalassolituus oleivorans]MBQ0782486.1 O-succinylhomoserine sulfhydrylase [Thalassolituus oleivorans]